MDISTALREAIWRVLNDPSASRSERKNRNRAIRIIGEEFSILANTEMALDNDSEEAVNQFESNLVLAIQVASKLTT